MWRRGKSNFRGPHARLSGSSLVAHSHCLPTCRASHHASMVLSRILIATPYNDSITVRRPAPRDHPPAFSRHRLPRAPETCATFTRGCMSSVARSTRSERLPGAFSKFLRGSGPENPIRATHDPCGASLLGQFASGPVQGPVVRTKKKNKKKMSKGQ